MSNFRVLFFWLALAPAYAASPCDLSCVERRMLTLIVEENTVPPASSVNYVIVPLAEQQPLTANGSWSDIPYNAGQNASWQSLEHLDRLLRLAMQYHTVGDKAALGKAKKALDFWLAAGLKNDNWWFNLIGAPTLLYKSMLLLISELSEDQKERCVEILSGAHLRGSGQNLLWMAEILLAKACVTSDTLLVREVAQAVSKVMHISPDEGIKPDYSFHQHYAQLYTGGYGAAYAEYAAKFIYFMHQTPYAFSSQEVNSVVNFVLEGQQWCTVGRRYDFLVVGREIVRPAKPDVKPDMCDLLVRVNAPRSEELQRYSSSTRQQKLLLQPYGNRYYYCSDFMIHRRPGFYFSVKNHSNRVLAGELVNGENKQGLYLSDGCIDLQLTGNEYRLIYPAWDWKRLPGITFKEYQGAIPLFDKTNTSTTSSFVGGISDGYYGFATAAFGKHGFKVNKSWFCFDDEVVCLGSGMENSDEEKQPLHTSVNQCLLNGEVLAGDGRSRRMLQSGVHVLEKERRVYHAGVLYEVLDNAVVTVENRPRQGSWYSISSHYPDTLVQENIFGLYLKHRQNTYAYVMYPNVTPQLLNKKSSAVKILYNNKLVQAVQQAGSSITQLVFFDSAAVRIDRSIDLKVSAPCLLMLRRQADKLYVSAASPDGKTERLQVVIAFRLQGERVKESGGKSSTIVLELPQGENVGQTVTESFTIS